MMTNVVSPPTTVTPNLLTALGLRKLSQGISYYEPDVTHAAKTLAQGPTLVIICSWAFAQPKHIAKYIQPYQNIYPSACILLVQNTISNSIWKPDAWQMSFFEPAATQIQTHLATRDDPQVLLHAFSNGGSHAAVQLSQACRETCGGMKLPIDALLLDSCPGQPRFAPTIAALVQGIPSKNPIVKGFGTIVAYTSVGGTALLDILNISEAAAWKLYRKLNDPVDSFLLKTGRHNGNPSTPVPRAYLYSKSDTMIMWDDVLGHARVAKEKLLEAGIYDDEVEEGVRLEEFTGTAHCNHLKMASETYWSVVQDTWRKAERIRSNHNIVTPTA